LNRCDAGLYLDTGLLVSLFHGDSGYPAAEAWLASAESQDLWISHWVLLEFASATAVRLRRGELNAARVETLRAALEAFRRERLGMLEPWGDDFLGAQRWLEQAPACGLKAADAQHLAIAHRHRLTLISADQALIHAAEALEISAQRVGTPLG